MPKVLCYPQEVFDNILREKGWDKVTPKEGVAFISIIGTPDFLKIYLEEPETTHLLGASENVLNLEFDDISEDTIEYQGVTFRGISMEQASEVVDFIDRHLGDDLYIHCRAGRSRSQGIVRYILDTYPEVYDNSSLDPDSPCLTPNMDVVCKLKRIWREKNQLGYS